jgi:hypothetical protein
MKKSNDLYELSPEQLEIFSDGKYLPGNYKREADAFLKTCIGAQMYDKVMSAEAGRRHPYVAARLFLSEDDWRKYVWIEQYGSLDDYPQS